jgi:hypothetical protein
MSKLMMNGFLGRTLKYVVRNRRAPGAFFRNALGSDAAPPRLMLLTFHKSGSHLITNVLEQMGISIRWASYDYSLADFFALPDRACLTTHFSPRGQSAQHIYELIQEGRILVVLSFRDPRDICVSRSYWAMLSDSVAYTPRLQFERTVNSRFSSHEDLLTSIIRGDRLSADPSSLLAWSVGDMFRESRALLFHPFVHKVRFEDLVGPSGGGTIEAQRTAVAGLASFLGVNAETDAIARTAFSQDVKTFRRGQIGGYRDAFTAQQSRLFNALHSDILTDYGYDVL